LTSIINDIGESVAKPNYNFARKQKELVRKARQQEKRKSRSTPADAAAASIPVVPAGGPAVTRDEPVIGSPT
jgi:hypothetical protein